MPVLKMSGLDLRGKRVFMRVDFNVPMQNGKLIDDTRIRARRPGIKDAWSRGARLLLASHLGRPTEGEFDEKESLAPVARHLSSLLGMDVPLKRDWLSGVAVEPGHAVLLENCRFNKGEKKDDDALSKRIAALCDIYVNDAFGAAHRAEATTHGAAMFAPVACAGPPLAGRGALSEKVDRLIPGGGIANTFMLASGIEVGKSLVEPELVGEARRISSVLRAKGGEVPLPTDVVCAKAIGATAKAETKPVGE